MNAVRVAVAAFGSCADADEKKQAKPRFIAVARAIGIKAGVGRTQCEEQLFGMPHALAAGPGDSEHNSGMQHQVKLDSLATMAKDPFDCQAGSVLRPHCVLRMGFKYQVSNSFATRRLVYM